jgi:hypothetical protein
MSGMALVLQSFHSVYDTQARKERKALLKHEYDADSYSSPSSTTLPPLKEDTPTDFSKALLIFLAQYPEFSSSQSRLEILHYCFRVYSNGDPEIRDLPVLEKLAHAGNIAKKFFSILTGAKL